MRLSNLASLAILALVSSCGQTKHGALDTGVAQETRPAAETRLAAPHVVSATPEEGARRAPEEEEPSLDESERAAIELDAVELEADEHVLASKDDSTSVMWRGGNTSEPGVVEVWRAGDAKPRARILSASVSEPTIDEGGKLVAWSESSGAGKAPFFHTLDVMTGVHARFQAKGPLCEIDEEHIVGFENGVLKTDAECNPGCPSLSSQALFFAYDPASGTMLRSWKGPLIPPSDDVGSGGSFTDER